MSTETKRGDSARALAERSRAEAETQYAHSEYPRYGRHTHRAVAARLDELAEWLDENEEPTTASSPYELRRLRRIYWLAKRGHEKAVEGARLAAQSHDMGSSRPMGQPLVGSPARMRTQRNAIERQNRKDDKAHETGAEADELKRRAVRAESNTSIQSADPEALPKLAQKLAALERQREGIKAQRPKAVPILNYRIPKDTWFTFAKRYGNQGDDEIPQIEMTKRLWKALYHEARQTRVPKGASHRVRYMAKMGGGGLHTAVVFLTDSKEHAKPEHEEPVETRKIPGYVLSNLGAEISRVKQRIAELEAREEYEERPERWIGEVRIVDNVDFHKVELWFPDKPSAETRALIKSHGFRWIRSIGCWSRSISHHTEYGLERLAEHLGEPIQ